MKILIKMIILFTKILIMIKTTLWVIVKGDKIFLWEKKRGFAKWVLNWVWWKREWNETMDDCMKREANEEIWIDIIKQEKVWLMYFYFEDKPEWNLVVYLYNIFDYDWDIVESEEIKPFWFDLNNIPYDKMWEFDKVWLPRILYWEKDIEYKVWYDTDNWKLLRFDKIK